MLLSNLVDSVPLPLLPVYLWLNANFFPHVFFVIIIKKRVTENNNFQY